MKSKNKFMLVLLPFLVIMGAIGASAGGLGNLSNLAIATPAASSTIDNDRQIILNFTVDGGSNVTVYNITWEAKSATTANSSWTTIAARTLVNLTDTNLTKSANGSCSFNLTAGTKNMSEFQDGADYQIRVTVTNATGAIASADSLTATVTGITIDYTTPTTPTSLTPKNSALYDRGDKNMEVNATINSGNTIYCTLYWVGKHPGANATERLNDGGANVCTKKFYNVPDGGYNYYITATDGSNTSVASAQASVVFDNDQASGAAKSYLLAQDGTPVSGGGFPADSSKLLGVAIIALIVWFVFVNKKK